MGRARVRWGWRLWRGGARPRRWGGVPRAGGRPAAASPPRPQCPCAGRSRLPRGEPLDTRTRPAGVPPPPLSLPHCRHEHRGLCPRAPPLPHPPAPTLTSTARLAARGGRVPRRRRGDGGRGVAAGGHLAGGRAAALAPRCRWLSPQRRVAVTTAAAAAAAAVAATTAAAAAGQAAAEEAVPRSPSALPLYPFPPFPAPSLSRLHPLSALNT